MGAFAEVGGSRGREGLVRFGMDFTDEPIIGSLDAKTLLESAKEITTGSDTIIRTDPYENEGTEPFFVERSVCVKAHRLLETAARQGGAEDEEIIELKEHIEVSQAKQRFRTGALLPPQVVGRH